MPRHAVLLEAGADDEARAPKTMKADAKPMKARRTLHPSRVAQPRELPPSARPCLMTLANTTLPTSLPTSACGEDESDDDAPKAKKAKKEAKVAA